MSGVAKMVFGICAQPQQYTTFSFGCKSLMGEEEDDRPSKPSTSISPTQGYHGPVNPYYPTIMMTPNTNSNPYLYHWTSIDATYWTDYMPYPPLSNPEELRRFQEIGQHPYMPHVGTIMPYHLLSSLTMCQHPSMPPVGSIMPNPPLSNPEELRRFQETNQHLSMPPVGPIMPNPPLSNPKELRRFQETSQTCKKILDDESQLHNHPESQFNTITQPMPSGNEEV
ncbi:hypothetical protein I3760_08G158900 [Carya illinoinensis]|nr:hypothetical protein I3760_08G158900 [Carya illinoinensis]